MPQRSTLTGQTRLFAGVAAVALLAGGAARAAEPAKPAAAPQTCQAGCVPGGARPTPTRVQQRAIEQNDVLGENGFYLESNELIDDDANGRVIARGEVEARYQGRIVRADEVEYRTATGLVVARGNARILNPDGTIQAADEITLDEDFRAGVAVGFSTELEQNVRIVAASAIRRSETVTDLNRAIYTPCPVCTPEGSPKKPTFSIQAERVIQDRERRVIYYRNAVVKVKDVPVFYAPVFFHADPTAERASGLLIPDVNLSARRGFSYEQPYYWAISPSQDLTITPQLNSKVNPFLFLEYRKRFYSGELNARFGYTYENDFDNDGDKAGDPEFDDADPLNPKPSDPTNRSFVLANGRFQLSDTWSYGFTAERASDQLIFDKYDVGDVYVDRGLYPSDDRRLISQLYTIRSGPRSYLSIGAMSFQGLRFGDDDAAFPIVAPLIEARYEPAGAVAGGRLRLRGSAVSLFRKGPVSIFRNDLKPVEELDSSRVTGEVDWRRSLTFSNGLRVEPLALLRGDAYRVGDRPPQLLSALDPARPFLPFDSTTRYGESFTRYNATVGAEVSYPLYRPTTGGSILLEPVAQVLISPDADNSQDAPNEDSQVFTFDETNIFDVNRFPGFDRYEGGQRVNVGGRATWTWAQNRSATVFAGRSFRAKEDLQFSEASGLRERGSDYILAGSANPLQGLTFGGRARLDGETGDVRRAEANVSFYRGPLLANAFYYYSQPTPTQNTLFGQTHDLTVNGQYRFRPNWGVAGSAIRDFENDIFRRSTIGVFYQDDCVRLDVYYEREQTIRGETFGPSNQIGFRLSLATLGSTGSYDYD